MNITDSNLKKIGKYKYDKFVQDYRRCGGRFYVFNDQIGNSVIYVERSYDPKLYWIVMKKNGMLIDVPIEVTLDGGLFEI